MRNIFKYVLGGLLLGSVAFAAANRVWESQEWLSGQITTPSNPSAGKFKFYFKSDGDMYKLNSSGVEEQVGGGGSAAEVTFASGGTIVASNVQDALEELDGDIVAHLGDTSDAHDASAISNVASGNIAATTVQLALEELDTEKATTASVSAKQDSDADLTALAGLASAGLVTRTASNTYVERTLTGTANQITVTNGDGVAGNPTVSIPSNPVFPGTGHSVNGISYLTGTDDPTTTATSAAAGSLYTNTTTGTIYRKTDAGSSTNWSIIGTSAAITAPTAYTPTFAGATPTGVDFKYMQIGNGYLIWGEFTAGSVSGSTFTMSVPNSGVINNLTATNSYLGMLGGPAAPNYLRMSVLGKNGDSTVTVGAAGDNTASPLTSLAGNAAFSNGQLYSFAPFFVPITGLASVVNTATTPIITAYSTYTPTFTGFGTVTCSNCMRYRQVGGAVEIDGVFTVGTTTSTEARMTLPSVCSTSASDYGTVEIADGNMTVSTNGAQSFVPLIEANKSYITFGLQYASAAGLTKALGSTVLGTGTTASLHAKVRCAGMPGVIPAPNLVGLATNNGSSAIRIESFNATGTCVVTEIGGSDVVNGNGSNPATGRCVYTINSGLFSSAPACVCTTVIGTTICSMDDAFPTTTSVGIQMANSAGALGAYGHSVMCMGAR